MIATRTRPYPTIGIIRAGWACVLLSSPRRVLNIYGAPVEPSSLKVVRILGVRHALQAGVEIARWPQWWRVGVLVDIAHGLSAIGLAASAPRWRRAGLTEGVIAATFVSFGYACKHPSGSFKVLR